MADETPKPPPTPEKVVARLQKLLTVEALDTDLYRGMRLPGGVGRVFGGQVIGQALMAACNSVESPRLPHSLHAYFLRAGSEDFPIIYRVERDFDGGSFTNRRIIAMQNGRPMLNMIASFQMPEEGLEHGSVMPDVPSPEELRTEYAVAMDFPDRLPPQMMAYLARPRPIEIRPVFPRAMHFGDKRDPVNYMWFRTIARLDDRSQPLHRSILGYASDMGLLGTGLLPHGISWSTHNLQSASLDHALWFHEDVAADEWMLYATDSPWAGHARSVNRGLIFNRDGRLIASAAQEGLMRIRAEKKW